MTLLERFLLDLRTDRSRYATVRLGEHRPGGSEHMHFTAASGQWEPLPPYEQPAEWAEVEPATYQHRVVKIEAWYYFSDRQYAATALDQLRRAWADSEAQPSDSDQRFYQFNSEPPHYMHSFDIWEFDRDIDPDDDPDTEDEDWDTESEDIRYCVQLIIADAIRAELAAHGQVVYHAVRTGRGGDDIDVSAIRARLTSAGVDLAALPALYDRNSARDDGERGFVIYLPAANPWNSVGLVFYGAMRRPDGAWQLSGRFDVKPVFVGALSAMPPDIEFLDIMDPYKSAQR